MAEHCKQIVLFQFIILTAVLYCFSAEIAHSDDVQSDQSTLSHRLIGGRHVFSQSEGVVDLAVSLTDSEGKYDSDHRHVKTNIALTSEDGRQTLGINNCDGAKSGLTGLDLAGSVLVETRLADSELKARSYELDPVCQLTIDTLLVPATYLLNVQSTIESNQSIRAISDAIEIQVVKSESDIGLPVILWGTAKYDDIPKVSDIGFTHQIGVYLNSSYGPIWNSLPGPEYQIVGQDKNLSYVDASFVHGLKSVAKLNASHWLNSHLKNNLYRIVRAEGSERPGKSKPKLSPVYPKILEYGFRVGSFVSELYDKHPGFEAAIVNTEYRSGLQSVDHSDAMKRRYRSATGSEIPKQAKSRWFADKKYASQFSTGVVPDDDPVVKFYRWYWEGGDGWMDFNNSIQQGIRSRSDRIWTFHDPSLRGLSTSKGIGDVDRLSHWTYSYPNPLRVGLAADELMAVSRQRSSQRKIMSMTQLIWYRTKTADSTEFSSKFLTISPDHLRQSIWSMLSRPISAILFHGWSAISSTGYKNTVYTNTNSKTIVALKEIIQEVVKPLGPLLKILPESQANVAFLESFTSQVLAGNGVRDAGKGWLSDFWLALRLAQIHPEIVYEESITKAKLQSFDVIVLPDCPYLPKSLVHQIKSFQESGGLIVGDEKTVVDIETDITISSFKRSEVAAEDRALLMKAATELRSKLAEKWSRDKNESIGKAESLSLDAVTVNRRVNNSDYVFVINDKRVYGDYVGLKSRKVMEKGVTIDTVIETSRKEGYVYDLVNRKQIDPISKSNESDPISFTSSLSAGGGALYLLTSQKISTVRFPKGTISSLSVGETEKIELRIEDSKGALVDAHIPVKIVIERMDGSRHEKSGYYVAKSGTLEFELTIARNDKIGNWKVEARELASGSSTHMTVKVLKGKSRYAVRQYDSTNQSASDGF